MKSKLILINLIFFLNSCAPKSTVTDLHINVKMIDQQERYFSTEIIPKFTDSTVNSVILSSYSKIDSLEQIIESNNCEVIKVPFEKGWYLVRKGLIKPLQSFLTKKEIKNYNNTYIYNYLGRKNNVQYFIPRKYETRILVYRKSQFVRIFNLFNNYKEEINIELARLNNFGLPKNYKLEQYPERWDFYDIFVIGWMWKNTVAPDGLKTGRIGHRSKPYSGTSHRIVDRIFQLNGTASNVLSMSGESVIDAFYWESILASTGIYNDEMLHGNWDGTSIWQSFKDGKTFLSFLTQTDCFFLHGTKSSQMKGYISDPEDLVFSTMPKGLSFLLDKNGNPEREGSNKITTGGWWWAIPSNAKNYKAAYNLTRHITNRENQINECSKYGMIPVRKDIYDSIKVIFKDNWIRDVYQTSYKQFLMNRKTLVPDHDKYNELSKLYLEAWHDIVIEKNWSQDKKYPDRNFIKFMLEVRYIPKARILIK